MYSAVRVFFFLGCTYADIGFLIDSSGSIFQEAGSSVDNWALMKQFVSLIISRLDLAFTKNLVGMVQFSSSAQAIFYLNTYINQSKALIYAKIADLSALNDPEQNTNTALGLR